MMVRSLSESHPTVRGTALPYEDGIPLESDWHLAAMTLLISILRYFWRTRWDIYVAGNMFVYFDPEQVKTRNFRGPDFFVVKGVKDNHFRKSWVVWEEQGLTPDYVIELASASTAQFDLTEKKAIYERILETPEYVVYDPGTEVLRGWRRVAGRYTPVKPDKRGWLWSKELDLWLGLADYTFPNQVEPTRVLRFFDIQGNMILTREEAEAQRAEMAERGAQVAEQRAEAAEQRAEAAERRAENEAKARQAIEEEIARLKARLKTKK
jgi:Uma2 family endonuclease